MLTSRFVLNRASAAALAATSIARAPPTRSSRRKRRGGATAGKKAASSASSSSSPLASTVPAETSTAADLDEVERLLAATTTAMNAAPSPSSPVKPSSPLTRSDSASRPVGGSGSSDRDREGRLSLDSASALHFKAVHDATALHDTAAAAGRGYSTATTTRDGPTHVQLEQIERRRSKPSLAEVEFDVGVSERLVPELPRLPALHEVNYGDAVVREVDRSTYVASQRALAARRAEAASTVVIDGETCVELSLDGDLTASEFAAFDAEAAATTAASGEDGTVAQEKAAMVDAETAQADTRMDADGLQRIDDDDDDAVAVPITFGTARPWFVPASGVVRLEPLPPADCARLLRFVLYLRQQTDADLASSLRRSLLHTEKVSEAAAARQTTQQQQQQQPQGSEAEDPQSSARGDRRPVPALLTLADVVRYLDTAPPPVIGFSESMPAAAAAVAASPRHSASAHTKPLSDLPPSHVCPPHALSDFRSPTSPAFVFHLYLENVSSQNAIGHLATLFGSPQRCFQSHSAVSKMSCSTVICAVAENRVRREHLLLLNTLRHPGFVLRVSNIQEVDPQRYMRLKGDKTSSNEEDEETECHDAKDKDEEEEESMQSVSHHLFGELARWQPLYQTEVLLRRVSGDASAHTSTRQQLEHRLRAVQTLGAICFCATREPSLARAATDVLHGFFKSALLNALQRRKAPAPLQRFLKRPNVATAQHAHHVSTDSTVRHVLKTFVQTNGDWHETVVRTPYVWRRRWINALRGLVWNTMASQRMRKMGREVVLGDVVLRPEFRHDVHQRGVLTVKAEHVMVVTTEAEAAGAELEDVCLPFLRGRYPEHLFAPESTNHPIMTKTNMLALLRSMHAPQLLLGLTDDVRLVLDVRAESSPMLFRRLLVKPLAMEFAILEDKPPMRSLHYDAARLLTNDRWGAAETVGGRSREGGRKGGVEEPAMHSSAAVSSSADPMNDTAASSSPITDAASSTTPTVSSPATIRDPTHDGRGTGSGGASSLIPPSEVLERTTLGSRLRSGVLADEFFAIPSPADYVVLGHAHRHLHGSLVPAAPHTDTAEVGDRVYTIYIRAVVDYSLSGLANMLREYFLLSGIETESESALQHKVHRMRRELDSETPLLTAPVYCTTCFNRDHDAQEQCAEYQFKVHRRAVRRDVVTAALEGGADAKPESPSAVEGTTLSGDGSLALPTAAVDGAAEPICDASPDTHTLRMRLHLRRRNDEQRWGVHLTKSLHFVGMEDVKLMKEGVVWNARHGGGGDGDLSMSMPDAGQSRPWPAEWITAPSSSPLSHEDNDKAADAGVSTTQNGKETPALAEEKSDTTAESSFLRFMAAALVGHGDEKQQAKEKKEKELAAPPATVMDLMLQSPVLSLPLDPAALQLRKKERTTDQTGNAHSTPSTVVSYTGIDVLKACKWTLKLVNATPVVTQRDVAAALLTQATKKRDVWLTFECRVDTAATATAAAATTPAATSIARVGDGNALSHTPLPLDLPTTHAANAIPQSTAALSPKKRHAVEAALRGALARTSPATQRWLMDMPHRLTLVLVKYRTHLHKHRSWGLQLDGTDMTLVNFARLMVQYMYVTESTERRRLLEHACVASVAPSAPFPRNDPLMTSRLFDEVLPSLEPLLNDTYRVVRLDNTPVRHKAEAARAMAAFQVKVDEELAALRNGENSSSSSDSSDRRANSISNADMSEFYLTLTLERKGSSYRVCASAAAAGAGQDQTAATSESDEAAMTAVDASKQEKKETVDRHTSTGGVSRSDVLHGNAAKAPRTADTVPAATASADASAIHVSPALLSGLATPQCPVHALTPPQLTRSTVTVAINRLVLTDQTREKWGLRLQQGTRRLKAIQQNRHFSFHVFAAKQSQGTRIADTLRLVSTSRRTPALDGRTDSALASEAAVEPSSSVTAHVMTRSFYLYFIERVNQRPVRAHAELRRELRTAALPQPQANASPARDGGGGAAVIHTLPPESLTLSLRQFPLLRITATVRRGGVDEGSALGPVGLQVDKRMRLLSVVAESPMARALTEAVGPLCSARRLIHHREKASGAGGDDDDVERDRGSGRTADRGATAASARWDVVVLPELRQLLAALDTACRRSPAPAATHRGDKGGANASQHQWAYDLDEDAAEAPSSSLSATSTVSASTHADPSNATNANEAEKSAAEAAALRALADASSRTLQELSKCSMVDGVHVLQTSLLYEYAVSRLTSTATTAAGGSDTAGSTSDTGDDKGLAKLQEDLASVFDQVRWEVVYAAQSNRPLRTPADLAAAFAPGVAEETISIQQFVED